MKRQLLEHCRDEIIVAEVNGKPNVVTFYSTASRNLHLISAIMPGNITALLS